MCFFVLCIQYQVSKHVLLVTMYTALLVVEQVGPFPQGSRYSLFAELYEDNHVGCIWR